MLLLLLINQKDPFFDKIKAGAPEGVVFRVACEEEEEGRTPEGAQRWEWRKGGKPRPRGGPKDRSSRGWWDGLGSERGGRWMNRT